jgi:hypothetical protein
MLEKQNLTAKSKLYRQTFEGKFQIKEKETHTRREVPRAKKQKASTAYCYAVGYFLA